MDMRSLWILAALVACHSTPPPVAPTAASTTAALPPPPPPPPPIQKLGPPHQVAGHAHVKAAPDASAGKLPHAPLFVTWLSEKESKGLKVGLLEMMTMRDMVARGVIVPDVDPNGEVTFSISPPTGKIALLAVVDTTHQGLAAIIERQGLFGISDAFDNTESTAEAPAIELAATPESGARDMCKGDRMVLETIDAPEVAGSVKNTTKRHVCMRLPKDYATEKTKRYPVIYGLPGLMGHEDEIIAIPDVDGAIIAMIDTATKSGSTYFTNSPTAGQWDSFLVKKVLPRVDSKYRTIASRDGRGLVGHSTGGYNAVSLGMRHPDLFGAIGSSSPDGLDFEVWLGSGTVPDWIKSFARVEHDLGGAGQFISYAAEWSPAKNSTGYDWPFDDKGVLVDKVAKRWLANTPAVMLRDAKRLAAFKPLSGSIYITVGDADEFGLHDPAVAFSKELAEAGMTNELVITHGGHITHAIDQLGAAARFCIAHLSPAK